MKLQKRHKDLLYSNKELMGSYALLEVAHEVMVIMVKDSQPHTCTCYEHVLVETCDSLIASQNDELKRK
jgi:hypothetical protein